MEFYDVVRNRRTVREWAAREVDEAALRRIIEAGLAAPSNSHLREWDFIVARSGEDKEAALKFVKEWALRQAEAKLAVSAASPAQKMYHYAMPLQYTMLAQAPYLVIPVFKAGARVLGASSVDQLNSFASIWCVIENIFLAAAAEGMACSVRIPVGGEGPSLAAALKVPEGYLIPCYIGIGYPAEEGRRLEQISCSFDERVHFGEW